jgi:glycosyltransferase involved in cell wall biosynthesis
MPAPTVSVILPTFNRAALLPRAINSVLFQTFSDLELIVVDDGSKDETAEVVAGIKDPRVVYYRRSHNGGVSAARNSGLAIARGAYVAFQDSDDEWLPDKLQRQVESLHEYSANAISVGVVIRVLGQTVRRWPQCAVNSTVSTGIPDWLVEDTVGYCQSLLAPRELVMRTGGFDETLSMWEDWDFLLRLTQNVQVVHCSGGWMISTRQKDSLTFDRSRHASIQGRIIDKHASLFMGKPRSFARLQYLVGRRAYEFGSTREAIRRLVRAITLNAFDVKPWVFLLFALFSPLFHWRHASDAKTTG